MANNLPAKQIGFAGCEINDIVNEYHKFYSIEEERNFGVVAIKVDV